MRVMGGGAGSSEAQVLKKAMTPLLKPPSGATLSPSIRRLIDDAARVVTTVVGGQTVVQRIPEPAPGEADDPRLPPTGTQNGGQRCHENWQLYGDMEEDVTWNGVTGDRRDGMRGPDQKDEASQARVQRLRPGHEQ
ncbi:hypothetical protein [Lentzea atacamensis]|uniref:hypothetical protein n=1 Tax=Lentzea atacamensis TaxID=531938 RepID=UPI001473F5CE|nr:hypothetical protein [Lentzea atacamensis]